MSDSIARWSYTSLTDFSQDINVSSDQLLGQFGLRVISSLRNIPLLKSAGLEFSQLPLFAFSLSSTRSQQSITITIFAASILPKPGFPNVRLTQVEGCTNLPELKTHDVEDLE